jgi:hypothetical protein
MAKKIIRSVYVDPNILQKAKMVAVIENRSLSSVLEEALTNYIKMVFPEKNTKSSLKEQVAEKIIA